ACSAWFLRRGTQKLSTKLADARKRIERTEDATAFASSYETISAELAADPVLGPRWREYSVSLVLPREGVRPVRATARASTWLDIGLLRAPGIGMDPRYHAAMRCACTCQRRLVIEYAFEDEKLRLRRVQLDERANVRIGCAP